MGKRKSRLDKCEKHPNNPEECDCKAWLVTLGCMDIEKEKEMIENEKTNTTDS